MIVRLATLADLTALRLFWGALCAEQQRHYLTVGPEDQQRWTGEMATRLERQSAGDPAVYVRIAVADDGRLLGFLSGWIEERYVGQPHRYWVADHLYVLPEARGDGIGTALVADGIAYAIAQGVPHLECVAIAGDDQWGRRGWAPILVRYATTADQIGQYHSRRRVNGVQHDVMVSSELEPEVEE